MTRSTRVLAAALAMIITVAVSPATGWAAPDFAALQIVPYESPKPAPAFELPDLDGRVQRLADLRGKVVLLFFWTTW